MKESYVKRGGGKVAKASKSSGGSGGGGASDHATAVSGGPKNINKLASYGKNANVRSTRLPNGGAPRC